MVGPPLRLRDALEYWDDMRVSPKAPLPYSYSDIQMMVTILTDKSLDKDIKLARATALLPERFRPADTPGEALCAASECTSREGLTCHLLRLSRSRKRGVPAYQRRSSFSGSGYRTTCS